MSVNMHPAAADGADAVVVTSVRQVSPGDGGTKATPDKLSAVYPVLVEADDRGDAQALARLGWLLFEIASTAQQAHLEAAMLLDELRVAARVATAGRGGHASLAMLRAVLARHGWLPDKGATPLQVLAAPNRLRSATG
jgi:glutathione S-transferase